MLIICCFTKDFRFIKKKCSKILSYADKLKNSLNYEVFILVKICYIVFMLTWLNSLKYFLRKYSKICKRTTIIIIIYYNVFMYV